MAALDFPASPTVGQKYPSPAVTGVPVYTWDGEKWTTLGGAIGSTGASDLIPQPDTGTGAAGSSTLWSRGDHAHPSDPTRAPINNPVFTGDPKAPTPTSGDNDTSIATTAFVTTAVTNSSGSIPTSYVRYDIPQTLTAPQQQQARANIYAAPFDAMAYGGLQINGGMEVSQELGTTGTNVSGKYVCDGWKFFFNGTMAPNSGAQPLGNVVGLPNMLYVAVTAGQVSLGAGDFAFVANYIEGYRIARLAWGSANAQPITIGFWSSHHRPGLYSVAVRNSTNARSYVTSYTHAVADIAQYNTITIPGDTAGTWAIDNTIGLYVTFAVGSGSTTTAPSTNTWQAGNYFAAPGQINGVAATSDAFRLTGVIVLPGNEAPSAARSPFVMRSYDQELVTCKRYFYNGVPPLAGVASAAGNINRVQCRHPVLMRAAPTITITSTLQFFDGSGISTVAAVGTNYSTIEAVQFDAGISGPTATYRPNVAMVTSGGNLNVDARL